MFNNWVSFCKATPSTPLHQQQQTWDKCVTQYGKAFSSGCMSLLVYMSLMVSSAQSAVGVPMCWCVWQVMYCVHNKIFSCSM